jgi:phosphoglycolate phosphatase
VTRFPLIVFDLDGTLVDSSGDLAGSVNELLGELGGRALPTAHVVSLVGEGARRLVERALALARIDTGLDEALDRFLRIYDRRLVETTTCYPGVESTLAALAGRATLAVLTNKPTAHSRRLLEHLGIERRFFRIVGGDGPYPRKPSPDGLLAVAAEAGRRADDTLFVGDSIVDARTAAAASVSCCLVRYGFGFPAGGESVPDAVRLLDTFADLLDVVGE